MRIYFGTKLTVFNNKKIKNLKKSEKIFSWPARRPMLMRCYHTNAREFLRQTFFFMALGILSFSINHILRFYEVGTEPRARNRSICRRKPVIITIIDNDCKCVIDDTKNIISIRLFEQSNSCVH